MYYDAEINLEEGDPEIYPNTPPHRLNASITYDVPESFDVSLQMNYVDDYEWLAGIQFGTVPTYTLFNLSAGYDVTEQMNMGLYIYNIFNTTHYQVFGGTLIPRLSTLKFTYNF